MARRVHEYESIQRLGQAGDEPIYARPVFWAVLVGAVGLFVIFRKKDIEEGVEIAQRKVSALVSDAERAIIKKFVPKGREGFIDATFELGAKYNLDPYLLLGILLVEGNFGAALSKGEMLGHTVYSGDFIPRGSSGEVKDRETGQWRPMSKGEKERAAAFDAHMARHPLPGVVKTYWERPESGNISGFRGQMWVPAHAIRVSELGIPKAYTNKVNGPFKGGIGWGFTPWALDWGSYAAKLKDGALWDADYATKVAIEDQILPVITGLKDRGVTDPFELLSLVIASYNIGHGGVYTVVANAKKKGVKPSSLVDKRTAGPEYVKRVMSIAKAAGREIIV